MRVLILANLDIGLYKFRRELLEELVKSHEVYFCVPDGDFVEKLKDIGCKFIPCNVLHRRSTNPIKDLKLIGFYRKILKSINPDVVLTYTIKPNVYGGLVCGLKRIPYIANVTGLGTTIENGGLLAAVSITLYKIGLRKANCVFFQNKENLKLFENKGIIKCKSRLIPGSGVNLKTHCFEPYPPDDKGVRFLFVGRIMKDKGIEELISAIRQIRKTRNDITLDIIGFCDQDYDEILRKAEEENILVNHGIQKDVHPFYKMSHCAVLPSYHEGMANVLLEASATGRPVIATKVPGCMETFDEGVTGFGCEAKSADSLVRAIERFLALDGEKREQMGIAAREKMCREFDRNVVIGSYMEELYQIENTSAK